MSIFSSRHPSLLFPSGIGLVFLLAILTRVRQVSFFFLSDDFTLIDAVAQGGPFGIWSSQGSPFFRPLVSLSFFLNYHLGGVNPAGYYLMNLLLHAANACLVTWIAWLLFGDQHRQPLPNRVGVAAIVAGACFAVAPTLGESVVWIAGRTDLIASFFGLLAFALVIIWRRKGQILLIAAGIACLVLGLLSKEAVITLPFALLGYEIFRQWSGDTWNIRSLAGWGLAAVMLVVAYIAVRTLAIGALIGGYGAAMHLNIRSIPIVLAQAFGHMFVMAPLRQGFPVTALIVTLCLVVVAVRWRRAPAPQRGMYVLPFAIAMLALIAFLPAVTRAS
jgi:protein O-mannosyl-transferase